mgnify:CR=1 FL=1
MSTLAGKVAVVTGGAQGIGRAIVERMLDSGAAVAIWDRDGKLAEETASELIGRGRIEVFAVDVTDLAAVEGARDATLDTFERIDILVNNAGISGPNKPTWEYPAKDWNQVMAINLTGAFHCCRAVVPSMIERNYGRIVNVASVAGKEGNPMAAAYSAAKAAVIGMTKSIGKDVAGTGVLVNCVTPAPIDTPMVAGLSESHLQYMLSRVPLARLATPDEAATLVLYLASEAMSFSTGAAFDLSGGRLTY